MTETATAVAPRRLILLGTPVEGADSTGVVFPYDGREFARVGLADAAQVEVALAGAAAAEREVAALPPYRRAEILIAAAALVLTDSRLLVIDPRTRGA